MLDRQVNPRAIRHRKPLECQLERSRTLVRSCPDVWTFVLPRCYQNTPYQAYPGRHPVSPDRFGLLRL